MKITFDPNKREATLRERSIVFLDAEKVLLGRTYTKEDLRVDYGEQRFQTIGFLDGRMVMVVWTPRSNARHIISMRKCNEREQEAYLQRFGQS